MFLKQKTYLEDEKLQAYFLNSLKQIITEGEKGLEKLKEDQAVLGIDNHPESIKTAKINLNRAYIKDSIQLSKEDAFSLKRIMKVLFYESSLWRKTW